MHNPIKGSLSFDCARSGCFTFVESASGMVRMFWYLFMLFNCQAEAVGELEAVGGADTAAVK